MVLGSYFRKYVKIFAKVAKPLHDQVAKLSEDKLRRHKDKLIGSCWIVQCEEAFQNLKTALTCPPPHTPQLMLLAHPEVDKPFHLDVDGSFQGLGSTLYQMDRDKQRFIAYASRTLRKLGKNIRLRPRLNFLR